MQGFRIKVVGRVQGVGFRYFCKTVAKQLHITGWVQNQDDGSVDLCISGSEKNVQAYVLRIKKPPHGVVESLDVEKSSATFETFEIK